MYKRHTTNFPLHFHSLFSLSEPIPLLNHVAGSKGEKMNVHLQAWFRHGGDRPNGRRHRVGKSNHLRFRKSLQFSNHFPILYSNSNSQFSETTPNFLDLNFRIRKKQRITPSYLRFGSIYNSLCCCRRYWCANPSLTLLSFLLLLVHHSSPFTSLAANCSSNG